MASQTLRRRIANRAISTARLGGQRIARTGAGLIERELAIRKERSRLEQEQKNRTIGKRGAEPEKEMELERALAEGRWRRRREDVLRLLKYNRSEIEQIMNEIKKIMDILEKSGQVKFRQLKDEAVRKSLAISMFEKFKGSRFALTKNQVNKEIIAKMISNFEKQLSSSRIQLNPRNGEQMMRLEELKVGIIEETLRQQNEEEGKQISIN